MVLLKGGVERRFYQHLANDSLIGKALRKYDPVNFRIEVLWRTTSIKTASRIEIVAIDCYHTLSPGGYNLTIGGESGSYWKGRKRPAMVGNKYIDIALLTKRNKENNPMRNPKSKLKWKLSRLKTALKKLENQKGGD